MPELAQWAAMLKDGGLIFSTIFVTAMYLYERKQNEKREAVHEEFRNKIIDVLMEVKVVVSNGNTLLQLLVSERK